MRVWGVAIQGIVRTRAVELDFRPPSAATPSVAELIRQRGELLVELRRNSEHAQQRMRDSTNKHRRNVEFVAGDLVIHKLQPYRQHSVARTLSAKLARRYYGPFKVLARIGQVAYRLELPVGSRIHNVFYVSLLRPFVSGDGASDVGVLPSEFFGDRPVVYPVRVLERRMLWQGDQPREHVLVRWSDGTDSPTWEPLDIVKRNFPNVLLEDKDVAIERGVDTIPSEVHPQQETTGEQGKISGKGIRSAGAQEAAKDEASIAKMKPKRNGKPPKMFGDYVAK